MLTSVRRLHRPICLAAFVLGLSTALAACAAPQPAAPRLRLVNSGANDIENLIVLFPDAQIEFGDVPAGAATGYQHAPNGVYSYAAYRFDLNGEQITQPVIDWVGEAPLPGDSFTYTIAFDPSQPAIFMIQLVDVTQDE